MNFGGPRDLDEVASFLRELLSDRDVVRSGLPKVLHNLLFRSIATLRASRIRKEYAHIGGKSPIYEDTEWLAEQLAGHLKGPIWTFHRYLKKTHEAFLEQIPLMEALDEIYVFPLFPQMSYATTGSIARWFQERLPGRLWQKLRWVSNYASHPSFINSYKIRIQESLDSLEWKENEVAILASFHGIPLSFVKNGDPYPIQCQNSFASLKQHFPEIVWKMSYQSKFGPGEWIRPYTVDVSSDSRWLDNRKKVLVVPLAFTSDHIETLSEIENQYLPLLKDMGVQAHRVSAINRLDCFVKGIATILKEHEERPDAFVANQMMIASYCPFPCFCPRLGFCSCVKNRD